MRRSSVNGSSVGRRIDALRSGANFPKKPKKYVGYGEYRRNNSMLYAICME